MATIKKAIAALNDAITIDVPTDQPCLASVQLPAGWAGTVVVEATLDDVNWVALGLTPVAGGASVALITAAGIWTAAVGAFEKVRARVSVAGAGGIAALSVSKY